MARYIDADALLSRLPDDLPYKGSVKRVLIQSPTADVAPKSEVDVLEKEIERLKKILDYYALQYGTVMSQQKVIDKAKSEVAREIFEEIERVIGEQYENYVFDNIAIEGEEQDAIIDFADTMKRYFDKLKKKYTEEKK